MSDVEKYGLFALVFVIGVLGLAWVLDPADEPSPANAGDLRIVSMSRPGSASTNGASTEARSRRAATLNRPEGSAPAANSAPGEPQSQRFRVASLLEGQQAFEAGEAPVVYPGERSTKAAPPRSQQAVVHEVKSGDTLSDISKRYFGTTTRWPELLALNPGLDPKALQTGHQVVVQAAGAGVVVQDRPTRTPETVYTVAEGETLGHIAQKTLGSVDQVDAIFQANRDVLKSPNDIKAGMHLRIP